MGNEIILDNVKTLGTGEILIDSVRQYRADCQLGQFKIGSSTLRGPKMDLEIVAARMYHGEYWGYEAQNWLALLFIDPDGVLSQILFKTESLSNFEEVFRQYKLKGESLLGKKLRCTFSKRSSRANNGNYYAVEFEVADHGQYAAAIAEFRQSHYSPQLFRQLEAEADAPALPAPTTLAAPTTPPATPALLPETVVESTQATADVPVPAAVAAQTVNRSRKAPPQAQATVH